MTDEPTKFETAKAIDGTGNPSLIATDVAPIIDTSLVNPPHDVPKHRYAGPALLALVFIVGMATSIFYFSSGVATTTPAAQTATAIVGDDPFISIRLDAQSAYVLDLTNNHVLFARNAQAQLPLASLTKVALALAVSEVLSPDAIITIPEDTRAPNSTERLRKGEKWRVSDIIQFTLIASANGSADILATAANDNIRAHYPEAPATNATLWRMNDIARNLGLADTYFLNVNGLDLSATQAGAYGSARDVARLFAFASTKAPDVFAGTTREGRVLTAVGGETTTPLNTDKALGSIPGLIMGKTGFTDLAGGNLAIVFDAGPSHPVAVVVLHSTESGRFDDIKKLVGAAQEAIAQGR